jgi:hypothetical protein
LGGRRNEGLQKRSETDEFTSGMSRDASECGWGCWHFICPLLLEQGHSKKKTEILMAVSLKSPWHTKRC